MVEQEFNHGVVWEKYLLAKEDPLPFYVSSETDRKNEIFDKQVVIFNKDFDFVKNGNLRLFDIALKLVNTAFRKATESKKPVYLRFSTVLDGQDDIRITPDTDVLKLVNWLNGESEIMMNLYLPKNDNKGFVFAQEQVVSISNEARGTLSGRVTKDISIKNPRGE
jgi:hypothetical protein